MFSILDRYIAREVIQPLIFSIIAITAILAGSSVLFNLVSEVIRLGIPLKTAAQLFILRIPVIMIMSFPMAMIMAVLLAFGRLSGDSEITAFRAGGIGTIRLMIPVLVVGMLVSLTAIAFNEIIVPRASQLERQIFLQIEGEKRPAIQRNVNITEYDSQGRPSRIINAMELSGKIMNGVTIAEFENGQMARVIQAESAKFEPLQGWVVQKGIMHQFNQQDKKRLLVIEFAKEYINIQVNPVDFLGRDKGSNEMNAAELSRFISKKKHIGQNVKNLEIEWHQKFAIPLASFIFAFLGAPLAIRSHRSSSALGIGVSLMIIIAYYILASLCMGFGMSGAFPAFLAGWLPNIIMSILGIFVLYRKAQ